jgi:hypothetical protein
VTDAPYTRLLELATREYELVMQDDFEGLEQVAAEREAIVTHLPATPPESAKPALVESARIQALTTAALHGARTRLAAEMAGLERGRETAAGYGRATGTAPARGTITVAA